jgi:hypothetical protein
MMAQDATSIVHMGLANMVKGGPIVLSDARAGKGEGRPEGQNPCLRPDSGGPELILTPDSRIESPELLR